MPRIYSPNRTTPQFTAIANAKTLDEVKTATIKLLRDLSDEHNYERQRMATALNSTGGVRSNYLVITVAEYFVQNVDGTIAFDTSGNAVNATLPLTTEYPGMTIRGIVVDNSNASTFSPRGADSINGVAGAYTVTTPVLLQADALTQNWVVVG